MRSRLALLVPGARRLVEGGLVPRAPDAPPAELPAVLPAPPHRPPVRLTPSEGSDAATGWPRLARRWLIAAALLVAAVHVVANAVSPYGVHRDELLYLAMGEHLRLWAMDFPPFVPMVGQFTRLLAGPGAHVEGTTVLRLTPALAHAALVGLAGVLARELGGRRGAQLLAALAVGASPLFLRTGGLFQPVVFDQLWWTLGLLALVRLGALDRRVDRRLGERGAARRARGAWALLGVALGLGLLTKFTVAFLAAGAAAGVLATPLRRALRGLEPWAAAALALVVGSPSVVGQIRLGWPVAGQMADLRDAQLARVGPLEWAAGQLLLGPAVLLAFLGLAALLGANSRFTRRLGRRRLGIRLPAAIAAGRVAGVAAAVAVALLVLGRGKPYYAGPVYPLLWAAGATALLGGRSAGDTGYGWRRGWWRGRRARLGAAGALVAAYGAATLPFGLPVLPPAAMARYAAAMGVGTETNTGERLALPQDYADMLGWPGMAGAAATAFAALAPEERADAAVVGGNYGEAGALALYGPHLGLPEAVSAAGSFWFFGPGTREGRVAVVVADSAEAAPELARLYADVRPVARAAPAELRRWMVPEERNAWVFVCRGGRRTLQEVWPGLKGRN